MTVGPALVEVTDRTQANSSPPRRVRRRVGVVAPPGVFDAGPEPVDHTLREWQQRLEVVVCRPEDVAARVCRIGSEEREDRWNIDDAGT